MCIRDSLNAILKEKINATLEPLMVSWGEYRDKLPLIYASGEAYDLVYVANWCNYSAEALKGPFLELSELMPIYAPKTYAEMEADGTLETAKVNGSLYMVPSTCLLYTSYLSAGVLCIMAATDILIPSPLISPPMGSRF